MTTSATERVSRFLIFVGVVFLYAIILVLLGQVVLFRESAPASEEPNFQLVKTASPPLPVPPPPRELPIPPATAQAGGGSETSLPPAVIMTPTSATFNLPKMPSTDEILARLPKPNFGTGSGTGSGDGNSSGTGDGNDGSSNLFGAKLGRDAVIHLDLNTGWYGDRNSFSPDGMGTGWWPEIPEITEFNDAVRKDMKEHFTHVIEYDADVSACMFTLVDHPDLDLLSKANDDRPNKDIYDWCGWREHYENYPGFNPKVYRFGLGHDLYATAYAAISALTQPDILIDPDKWYAPYGEAHGVPAGQPEVLIMASDDYVQNGGEKRSVEGTDPRLGQRAEETPHQTDYFGEKDERRAAPCPDRLCLGIGRQLQPMGQ